MDKNFSAVAAAATGLVMNDTAPKSVFRPPSKLLICVYAASAVMFVTMIALTVINALNPFLTTNLAVMIANILLWLVPFVFKPLFKSAISDGIYLFFVIYTFVASFLGSVLNFYDRIWWFDLAVHSLFGYVGCVIGLFFVCKLSDVHKAKAVYVVFVCVATSLAIALLWEIFEFAGDVLVGNYAQGAPILGADGKEYITVNDTMEDVICNTCGAIVFMLHYIVHTLTKKPLFMDALKNDFSSGKKDLPAQSDSAQPEE